MPHPRGGNEEAVAKATWVGGGEEEGGRRKDGLPRRSRREVTEASPAPCILPPVNLPPLFFRLLPAVAAAAAPEPLLPLAQNNTMAEPGHSLHPSARGRGRTEPRTLRLLRLLLWVGTTFQVTQGAGPELHACKEVYSPPDPTPLRSENLGSRQGSWDPRKTVSEATEFRFLWGWGVGEEEE